MNLEPLVFEVGHAHIAAEDTVAAGLLRQGTTTTSGKRIVVRAAGAVATATRVTAHVMENLCRRGVESLPLELQR